MHIQFNTTLSLLAACALTLALPVAGAAAQDKDDDTLPRGTYKSECTDIRVEGRYLYASCPDAQGNMTESKVRYRDCINIRNNNGKLRCQKMAM